MEKILCITKVLLQAKTSLLVLFNATAESVNCFFFLEKSRNKFLQCDLQKNFVKRIENLSQHLSEKFIGDN